MPGWKRCRCLPARSATIGSVRSSNGRLTGRVVRVLEIPPDFATCETLGSGQGIANLLDTVVVGSGATAGQLWVGGGGGMCRWKPDRACTYMYKELARYPEPRGVSGIATDADLIRNLRRAMRAIGDLHWSADHVTLCYDWSCVNSSLDPSP